MFLRPPSLHLAALPQTSHPLVVSQNPNVAGVNLDRGKGRSVL